MRVGVLGGGLQGSCIALALAERGVEVILFETTHCSAGPRSIHLGYMYAGDPTLRTQRRQRRKG